MNRQIGAGLAMVASLSLAVGCETSNHDAYSERPLPIESPTTIPGIEITPMPDKVPEAVLSQVDNVVSMQLRVPTNIKHFSEGGTSYNPMGWGASGIRLDSNHILTAGHIPYETSGKLRKGANVCSYFFADSKSTISTGSSSGPDGDRELYGAELSVSRIAGTFIDKINSKVPDVALLENEGESAEAPIPQPVKFGEVKKRGEKVYFVNYQPDNAGKPRDPSQFGPDHIDDSPQHNSPAIYGGEVVSKYPNGNIIVLDGLKGYGKIPDNKTRGGASGGPVFNEKGELFGVVSRGLEQPQPASSVAEELGINLNGINPDKEVSFSVIQVVTSKTVGLLAFKLAASPHCIYPVDAPADINIYK